MKNFKKIILIMESEAERAAAERSQNRYGTFLRMLPEVFYELLREIEHSITKQNTVIRDSLPPDMKLAATWLQEHAVLIYDIFFAFIPYPRLSLRSVKPSMKIFAGKKYYLFNIYFASPKKSVIRKTNNITVLTLRMATRNYYPWSYSGFDSAFVAEETPMGF